MSKPTPFWAHQKLPPGVGELYADLDRMGEARVRDGLLHARWGTNPTATRSLVESWLTQTVRQRQAREEELRTREEEVRRHDEDLRQREVAAAERAAQAAADSAAEARLSRKIAAWALGVAIFAAVMTAALGVITLL